MRTERPNPTDPPSASFFEFVSISGTRVFVAADVWFQTLDVLDFPLDGGGGLAILSLADTGLAETALVFAPPANALAPLSEPIRLEVAFARGKNTVLMGLAAPSPTPVGDAVLFTAVDLGKPGNRACLAEFASQRCIHLLVVHPRRGALLGDIEMRSPDMLGHIREILAATTDIREMDLSEGLLAYAELYNTLRGAPEPPDGGGAFPETPWAKNERQPRNAPCRCGSGLKSKHCCG
jgi:hypothetical protein